MDVTSHFLRAKMRPASLFLETRIKNDRANTHARLKISRMWPIGLNQYYGRSPGFARRLTLLRFGVMDDRAQRKPPSLAALALDVGQ